MTPILRKRLKRFTLVQRLFHLGLMLCFVVQAATGVARMYAQTDWGRDLATFLGGHEQVLAIHKAVGLALITLFFIHLLYAITKIQWTRFPSTLFQPDSILPRRADIRQFLQHTLSLVGLARPPSLDRWAYWEKFDYWAVFWGMVIIGGSGLILYDPVVTSRIMPGWSINLALWIHRIEALLAMGHIFIIHFFIAHFRRHAFPMDMVMFEGHLDLELVRHERPDWVQRLEEAGTLEQASFFQTPSIMRGLFYCFGLAVVTFCWYLMISGLVNFGRLNW